MYITFQPFWKNRKETMNVIHPKLNICWYICRWEVEKHITLILVSRFWINKFFISSKLRLVVMEIHIWKSFFFILKVVHFLCWAIYLLARLIDNQNPEPQIIQMICAGTDGPGDREWKLQLAAVPTELRIQGRPKYFYIFTKLKLFIRKD